MYLNDRAIDIVPVTKGSFTRIVLEDIITSRMGSVVSGEK